MINRCYKVLHGIYKLHLSKYYFEIMTESFINMFQKQSAELLLNPLIECKVSLADHLLL